MKAYSHETMTITLATVEGKELALALDETTKCRRGTVEASCHTVATGERAVVTYETKGGVDRALEIRLAER